MIKLTNSEYHKLPSISNSRLKIFRESRAKYRAMYIDRCLEWKQTKDQLLGSIVHAMIFEPDQLDNLYRVAPECDRRTNAGKAIWAEFCNSTPASCEVVTDEMWEQALRIRDALLMSNYFTSILNQPGLYEQPLFWTDPISGIECRCKPDKMMPTLDLICDLKVLQDSTPEGFERACNKWEYDCQNAFYNEGYRANYGETPNFVFVAVSKKEPYEIGFYELDADDIAEAHQINHRTIATLKACHDTNDWIGSHEREVVKIRLKRYARHRFDYTELEEGEDE